MRKPIKYVEKAVVTAAKGAWVVFDRMNRVNPNPSPTPKWSDKPLLKSYEKTKPRSAGRVPRILFAPSACRKSGSRFLTGTCRTKC